MRSLLLRIPEQGWALKIWLFSAHQCRLLDKPLTALIRCLAAPMCDHEGAVYMHGTGDGSRAAVYFLDQLAAMIGYDTVLTMLRTRAGGASMIEACAARKEDTSSVCDGFALQSTLTALMQANWKPVTTCLPTGAMAASAGAATATHRANTPFLQTPAAISHACIGRDTDSGIWDVAKPLSTGMKPHTTRLLLAAPAIPPAPPAPPSVPCPALPDTMHFHTPVTVNDARLQTVDCALSAIPHLLHHTATQSARVHTHITAMLSDVCVHDAELGECLRTAIGELQAHAAMTTQLAVMTARAVDAHRDLNLETATAVLGNMNKEMIPPGVMTPAGADVPGAVGDRSALSPLADGNDDYFQQLRQQAATCGDVGILGLLEWSSVDLLPAQKVHVADAFARASQHICKPDVCLRSALEAIHAHPHCGSDALRALAQAELLCNVPGIRVHGRGEE